MAATKLHTKTVKAKVLQQLAEMDRMGLTQQAMGDRVGLTQGQVSIYLKQTRQQLLATMLDDRREMVALKLQQYAHIRTECWDAYERSKQDAEKEVNEFGKVRLDDDDELPDLFKRGKGQKGKAHRITSEESMEKLKQIVTREGRLPASTYLNIIMQTHQAERDMLGLDEAMKVDMSGTVVNVSWDDFVKATGGGQVPDNVSAKVVEQIIDTSSNGQQS